MEKDVIYIVIPGDWAEGKKLKKKIKVVERAIKAITGQPVGRIRPVGLLKGLEIMLEELK